ncbi:MAG TPA: AAA family ATPase [Acidimicrobiales bacterium]
MRLEITLTGDVTVAGTATGVTQVVTGPPRVVLAALVLDPGGVARDRLAGIVWPESMPRTWASALRTHVSKVRTLVTAAVGGAGETIVSGDAGYHLVLPDGVALALDVHEAERELEDARRALAGDPATARRLACRAADRLRAPFLPGHPGAWAESVRAHLDDVAVTALEVAAHAAAALGDGAGAVETAADAVQRAPLRESAHRALMAAYTAAGNRADALAAYRRLRHDLADELGIDPSPETEAAYLELLGPVPSARPPGPPTGDELRTVLGGPAPGLAPFVGRAAELEALAAAWEQAAAGARHLVVVTGEAGIGKSRLAAEAARRAYQDGGVVLFGRCDPEPIVPYQPLVEALDGLVAATPVDDLPAVGERTMAELATVLPSIDRPRRPGGPDRAALFAAVTDLVAAAARERPLLLVLDDLQWADDDTLLLLRHLLRRAGDAPVLVIAISRDHDLEPGHTLADVIHALDRDGWVRRVRLRGLSEPEVGELLGHICGPGDHGGAARRLVAETAGNPFLVTELARARRDGAGDAGSEIPQGVHDLVRTRLARLDDATVGLLRAGAVVGARFDLDIAAAVAGLDRGTLLDAADAALASGLVDEDAADCYRFPHDIVRRTLLAQVSGARLRSLHAGTADAIERLRADDLEGHAAVLAHHSAAGAARGGDERAVRWARRASALAARRSAPAEAVRLCRQALAHVPPGRPALQAEVMVELGAVLLAAGDPSAAATLLEGAELASRHCGTQVTGRAALALADAAGEQPGLRDEAVTLVRAALAATDRDAGPAEAGTEDGAAEVLRARLLVRRLRLTGNSAASGVRRPAGMLGALHDRIAGLSDPRDLDERRRLADELAELATATGDHAHLIRASHERAMVAATVGDEASVTSSLATVAALTAEHDDSFGAAALAERAVARSTTEGRFAEARAALDAAVAAVAADRGRGGPDGADAVAARHRAVIGWLTGESPLPDLAHRPPPDGPERLHALALAALSACERRDPVAVAEVRAALAPGADLVCGLGYRTFVGAAAYHLGRLAAAAGDLGEAERHLLAALRLHSALRARPWVALTQDALADVLETRGHRSDRDFIAGLRAEAGWLTADLGLRT